MSERRRYIPAHAFIVEMLCAKDGCCGFMRPDGTCYEGHFPHSCNECGRSETLRDKWPQFDLQPNKEQEQ